MSKRGSSRKHQTNFGEIKRIQFHTVDIIIPVFNRFDLLQKCLDALPKAFKEETFVVYIFDNGSDKEEADKFYAQPFPFLCKVTRNKTNTGFPYAVNRAARLGTSPFVFVLNDDVVMDEGSGDKLVLDMKLNPKIGALGMKLVFPDYADGLNPQIRPAGKVQHVGLFTNISGNFFHIFVGWDENNPKVNAVRECHAVTGAALMTTRKIWNTINGFYEGYGKGTWEDIDLCLSCHSLGYNVMVDTAARAVHYTGATAEKYQQPFPLNENRLLFLQRWQSRLLWTEWQAW